MEVGLVEPLADEPILQAALKRLSGYSKFRCIDPDHSVCRQALADLQYTVDFVTKWQPTTRAVAEVSRHEIRKQAARVTSWAVPNEAALNKLVTLSPIVEIGAGLGFWAHLVEARGGKVLAYDSFPPWDNLWFAHVAKPWHLIDVGSSSKALKGPSTLFICWPPGEGDPMAHRALRDLSGETLVYVGEADSSCMATPEFFALLEAEWRLDETVEIPQWPSCFDKMFIYRKKAA